MYCCSTFFKSTTNRDGIGGTFWGDGDVAEVELVSVEDDTRTRLCDVESDGGGAGECGRRASSGGGWIDNEMLRLEVYGNFVCVGRKVVPEITCRVC